MGSVHALSLHGGQVPDGVLVAVCDIAPSRRQWAEEALPDVAVFDNFDDLLAADIAEAVVIATPHYFYPPMAIAAFAKGLHVLSEKPGGVQVSEVERMCAAAKASGKVFGVMFNQRTHPLFRRVREIVQGGELGALKRVQWTVTNWYRTQDYYNSGGWRASWTGERGKLVLEDNKLHFWKLPTSEREFCFGGEIPAVDYLEITPNEQETAHNGILRNFTGAVLRGEELLAPGYDAINELSLSNAAYLSAWTGETVSLPFDTARFDALLAEKAATSAYQPNKATNEADGVYKNRWNVNR